MEGCDIFFFEKKMRTCIFDIFTLTCEKINMKNIHKETIPAIQQAVALREQGRDKDANKLFVKAFNQEKQAALSLQADFNNEPARSTLFRNAASLAMNCREYVEAEKLAAHGLAGNPPQDMMNELRELYQQINARLFRGNAKNIV